MRFIFSVFVAYLLNEVRAWYGKWSLWYILRTMVGEFFEPLNNRNRISETPCKDTAKKLNPQY